MGRRRTTTRGKGPKKPTMSRDTTVTTGSGSDSYKITVKKGSPYAKLAKKMGSVPASFRAGSFSKKTDPYASGISGAEKKKRKSAYGASTSSYKKASRKN